MRLWCVFCVVCVSGLVYSPPPHTLSSPKQAEVNREVVALEDSLKAVEKLAGVGTDELALAREVKDQANKVLQVGEGPSCVLCSFSMVLFPPPPPPPPQFEACRWSLHSCPRR